MVLAKEYIYTRILGLCLSTICLILSSLQLLVLIRRKNGTTEIKHFIHYCGFFFSFLLIFPFIDPGGVFGLIPNIILMIIQFLASEFLAAGFCIVVYSHFRAHYLTLREDPPKFFIRALIISMIFGVIGGLCGTLIPFFTQKSVYRVCTTISSFIWIILVVGSDFYAYYLIRRIILDMIQRELTLPCSKKISKKEEDNEERGKEKIKNGQSSPETSQNLITRNEKSQTSKNNSKNNSKNKENKNKNGSAGSAGSQGTNKNVNYEDFLKRIRKFHFLCGVIGLFFIVTDISDILSAMEGINQPPSYPQPEEFKLDMLYPYIFMIVWGIFTWWAWVPLDFEMLEKSYSSNTTYFSKTEPEKIPSQNTKGQEGGGVEIEIMLNDQKKSQEVLISENMSSSQVIHATINDAGCIVPLEIIEKE